MGRGMADLLGKKAMRGTGRKTSRVFTVPAPVDGLNKAAALTDMKITEALVLENVTCGNGNIRVRYGLSSSLSSLSATASITKRVIPIAEHEDAYFVIESGGVWAYISPNTNNNLYSNAAFTAKVTYCRFSTTGDTFTVFVGETNGIHTYSNNTGYEAALWNASLTGPTTSLLEGVATHAERLWIWERESTDIWYLPVASVTGAAEVLPLAQFMNKGGYVIGARSWTRDGGDGMDDYLVIFTSGGEAIIYQGIDPDDPDNWQKVGTFDIGKVVARTSYGFQHNVVKVGGDLGVLTQHGVALLSQLASTNESEHAKISITYKMHNDWQRTIDGLSTDDKELLHIFEYPRERLLIIQSPDPDSTGYKQFVMNVETNAWSTWKMASTKWFALGTGGTLKAISTTNTAHNYVPGQYQDGTSAISWRIQTAYTTMKTALNKNVSAVKPYIVCSAGFMPIIELKVDFDNTDFNASSLTRTNTGQSAPSNATAQSGVVNADWCSVGAEGMAFSVCLSGSTRNYPMEFNAIDILYEIEDIF